MRIFRPPHYSDSAPYPGKGVPLFTQEEGQRFYQLDSLRQFGPFAELVSAEKVRNREGSGPHD